MELSFEKQNHWGCRHPGRGARERPGRRTERGRVKQQCGVSGGAGRRQSVDGKGGAETRNRRQFRHRERRKKHGESARLKNKGARGAKKVGGKRGLNAGAQDREEKAGALPKQNERIGRSAEQRADPIVK